MDKIEENKWKQSFMDYVSSGMYKYGFDRDAYDFEDAINLYKFLCERKVIAPIYGNI